MKYIINYLKINRIDASSHGMYNQLSQNIISHEMHNQLLKIYSVMK